MSAKALTWAWGVMPAVTSTPMKLVLVALADRADDDGELYPKTGWVAEKIGLSKSTVRKHIGGLEELGLLQRQEQHRANGSQTSNLLRLVLEAPRRESSATPPETERPPAPETRRPGDDHVGDDHQNNSLGEDLSKLWEIVVDVCKPANTKLTPSRARVLRRALGEAPLDLCGRAVHGLDEYVKRTGKGQRDVSRVFVTRPGGSALADQIEWWANQSSTHQPQRHRNLPPHVRDGLITARNHPTARWVATLNGGLDGRWLTDDEAINAAYDRAVAFALERFGLRVVWREVVPGEGYVRLEFQEVTR